MDAMRSDVEAFEQLVADVEPRLRRALVAAYGSDQGREATAAALSWAWEHRHRLGRIEHKVAYLFRVGQSRIRRRLEPVVFVRPDDGDPWVEPALAPALAALSESERTAVVLVHGFAWKLREVAELTGIKVTTVQSNLERGLRKLRAAMEVQHHA
jgi:DNA-directed RNA polymerase specialized sigma24 family protein